MPDLSETEWGDLCPSLSIGESIVADPYSFSEAFLAKIADQFWENGFLEIPSVFGELELQTLIEAMICLEQAKIPPAFIYIYDQPWALFERLRLLISHFLGEEYAVLPNLWAWHMRKPGATGWPPHRDCDSETVFNVGPDQMLMSLSLWLPLTSVDEANGCMYVIPRQKEEKLSSNGVLEWGKIKSFGNALPAPAGSVLGWPQDLVHWGGTFTEKAKEPRISLSFEFQNTSFAPLATPLLNTANPPPFEQRISLIQEQFAKYRHIAPDLD